MQCRSGCGACCIAPSITSPLPNMPQGKPAGVRCFNLDKNNLCRAFGDPSRPEFCLEFKAMETVCGKDRQQALDNLIWLENATC